MKKRNRITILLFVIFSIILVVLNLLRYEGIETAIIIAITLTFNLCLVTLGILIVNKIVKLNSRNYLLLAFYLIISTALYWITISTILHFYYGTYLSVNGLYFYVATRTTLSATVFFTLSVILILTMTFAMFKATRKKVLDDEKIEKINKEINKSFKKNMPKNIFKKRIKIVYFIVPLMILLLIISLLPKAYSIKTSPIINFITKLLRSRPDSDPIQNFTVIEKNKILNLSLDNNPNLIIIMLESVSSTRISYHGYERETTPNIDSLAEKSIVFNNAFASASHSDSSQPTFLSSRYVLTNEYRNFYNLDYPREFVWDVVKKQGYETAYISSQDDNWANMIDYYNISALDVYSYSLTDGEYDYGSGKAKKDYDEKTINKSINWLNQTTQPFFLYINLQATHYAYEYPENNSVFLPDEISSIFTTYFNIGESDQEASENRYDNSLYYVDKHIGILLDYLEENKLLNNTIIVLTSDHGETLVKNHGFLRHGFGVYQEEVRVPMFFYIPNQEPRIINENVAHIDVVPTILSIMNFPLSSEFQGTEFVENPEIFLSTQNQNFKIGTVKDNMKYILDMNTYMLEVYNLTEDLNEQNNLVKDFDDEDFYTQKYGVALFQWYDCQLDYYQNKRWEDGEKINCQDARFRAGFSSLRPSFSLKFWKSADVG